MEAFVSWVSVIQVSKLDGVKINIKYDSVILLESRVAEIFFFLVWKRVEIGKNYRVVGENKKGKTVRFCRNHANWKILMG